MISSQSIDYTDPLSGVDPVKMVCYWVTANENLAITNPKSNTCCIIKEPAVFMPNAFYPDGINKYLRPLPNPVFADPQSFELTVFNRWGQQIFKTTDMSKGWDGSITGQPAPAGLYTYLLTYKSINGQGYTKRGTAQLIR
jgi:gliding motility-associated-like protein